MRGAPRVEPIPFCPELGLRLCFRVLRISRQLLLALGWVGLTACQENQTTHEPDIPVPNSLNHNSAQSTNRLSLEKSPYLLQHQHNPVDWYAWGQEAFRQARRENKPIFLSIGYSTCQLYVALIVATGDAHNCPNLLLTVNFIKHVEDKGDY